MSTGGAIIGEGAAGCIFYPPYPCAIPYNPQIPMIAKMVDDTPATRNEITLAIIVQNKLKRVGLEAVVPVHVCKPGQPTAEEMQVSFKVNLKCNDKIPKPILLYIPYVKCGSLDKYIKGTYTVPQLLQLFTGAFRSVMVLSNSLFDSPLPGVFDSPLSGVFDSPLPGVVDSPLSESVNEEFIMHADINERNILANCKSDGTVDTILCDFGNSYSPTLGPISEWYTRRVAGRFERVIARNTFSATTLCILASIYEPAAIQRLQYIHSNKSVRNESFINRGADTLINKILNAWKFYINHIVFSNLANYNLTAAIRFNDIHAICAELGNTICKTVPHGPTLLKQAHKALMNGSFGGYRAPSAEEILIAAKEDLSFAVAILCCIGTMDSYIFYRNAPQWYWLLYRGLLNLS